MRIVFPLRLAALLIALCSLSGLLLAEDQVVPEKLGLWNGHAALGDDQVQDTEVFITLHRPAQPNGTAAVICPGGGYGGLVTGAEGHGIAAWLNGHGVTGVVLEYRLPAGRHAVPLLDAQRAIRTVRANAKAWGIDPAKIGIIGFSAGGHLASTAATHFDAGKPEATDAVEKVSCRPDFAILVYPVISMGELTHGGSRNNLLGKDPSAELIELYSNEKQVTKDTPPTFLFHTSADTAVPPENAVRFYLACKKAGVPVEMHIYEKGRHGVGLGRDPKWTGGEKSVATWPDRLTDWMKARQLLGK